MVNSMGSMRDFIIRRTVTFIPTIIGVSLIAFIIAYVIPADPARAWAGGEKATQAAIELIRKRYHLDEPLWSQYVFFVKGFITNTIIDPRTSNPIMYDIAKRLPVTIQLTLFAYMFILALGIPLGIIAALKKNTIIDSLIRFLALVGVSSPVFWLGYLLIYVFFVTYRVTHLAGVPPPPERTIIGIPVIDALLIGDFKTFAQHVQRFWLPGFVLGFMGSGVIARFVRNSFLEALNSDYIVFLKAKGVTRTMLWKHAFKNALVPVITILGLQFGGLLSGAPITETVFGLPGLGRYAIQAIIFLDFPAIVGITLVFALIYVTINFIIDILYGIIDPRVRY